MSKATTRYVCQSCGYETGKWMGRCPNCDTWGSLNEEFVPSKSEQAKQRKASAAIPTTVVSIADAAAELEPRISSGIADVDRVLGGGVVPGSLTLVGGDPGIGKSTLLTQVAAAVANKGGVSLYISGEESVRQVKLRANRLGGVSEKFYLASETDVHAMLTAIYQLKPQFAVIDSIQTLRDTEMESASGSVSQIRACASYLQRCAKDEGIPIFIIGHITKDGAIAGPKTLEHIVDTVLYFEGDAQSALRILRVTKNRFGPCDETAVFEMREQGLFVVDNPSEMLLAERNQSSPGSCVTACVEGSRAMLTEVQALTTTSYLNNPRRVVTGLDYNRTNLTLAVLEKRLRFKMSRFDVFANIPGGIRVTDPSVDLALVVAISSSVRDKVINPEIMVFGEVGLGGEVRAVRSAELRLKEAARLGFSEAVIPDRNRASLRETYGMKIHGVKYVSQAVQLLLGKADGNSDDNDPFE